jgi:integration host factor subunit alpha
MSLGKKDIIKNISHKAQISSEDSKEIFNSFVAYIKSNRDIKIKISNFGTFSKYKTLKRIGRNPKTKDEFVINPRVKLKFNPSNKIKHILN